MFDIFGSPDHLTETGVATSTTVPIKVAPIKSIFRIVVLLESHGNNDDILVGCLAPMTPDTNSGGIDMASDNGMIGVPVTAVSRVAVARRPITIAVSRVTVAMVGPITIAIGRGVTVAGPITIAVSWVAITIAISRVTIAVSWVAITIAISRVAIAVTVG
jgi:hypothetical protein